MADVTKKDTTIATVRTGWNMAILTLIAGWIAKWTGIDIDLNDPVVLTVAAPIIGVVGGIFYRLSRVLADVAPWIGYVLFGANAKPVYTEPEPAVEPLPEPEPVVVVNVEPVTDAPEGA